MRLIMSDSEESVVVPVKRKRTYNIEDFDDQSSSSSSDSSVIINPNKRSKRYLTSSDSDSDYSIKSHTAKDPQGLESEGSDWESDWSSDNTIDLVQKIGDTSDTANLNNCEGSCSDSNDENSEKCPICLLRLSQQEVATPESCQHAFCFDCLQEWSKNVSTCPIDRKEFQIMLVRKNYHAVHTREVKVIKNKVATEEAPLEDTTFCEICRLSDREDSMLLCDGCDCGFHMECLTPRLDRVPLGDWFCETCADSNNSITDDVDAEPQVSRTGFRHTSSRLIPRTRQSERVRSTVETMRGQARQYTLIDIFDADQPSTSSGFVSSENLKPKSHKSHERVSKPRKKSTKTVRKTKRRTRRKRRKYVTEYEICQETGAKIAVKKLVRGTGKRKYKKRRSTRKSSNKKRSSRSKTSSKKTTKESSGKNIEVKSAAPTLHLFGRRDELDYFFDDSDEDKPTSSKDKLTKKADVRKSNKIIEPVSSSFSLDSILESQAQCHSKKSHR